MYIEGGVPARLRSCECLRAYPLTLLVRNHRTRAFATRCLQKRLPEPPGKTKIKTCSSTDSQRAAPEEPLLLSKSL